MVLSSQFFFGPRRASCFFQARAAADSAKQAAERARREQQLLEQTLQALRRVGRVPGDGEGDVQVPIFMLVYLRWFIYVGKFMLVNLCCWFIYVGLFMLVYLCW